jgi:hypothetical protein
MFFNAIMDRKFPMEKKTELEKFANAAKPELLKKIYQKPVLKTYGLVKHLTQTTGCQNGDTGGMKMVSDRSAKENIVRINNHPLGIGLYLFDYKPEYRERCGVGRQFGVIADEVEAVMPRAVVMHLDGYKMVDYAMLGISHPIQ